MANQNTARIDENDRPTLLAYNETTSAPEDIRVDAVLGYMEIFNSGAGSGTFTATDHARIDGNDNPTLLAWNDTTSQIEAVRCDDNGNLLVKMV